MSLIALAAAQALSPAAAIDYQRPEHWLCLPGRKDSCSTPLDLTELEPSGYGRRGPSNVAADPGIDCFYVYPTMSQDRGLNSDLAVSDGEERAAVRSQFARFASACRPFAPVYRQLTLSAVTVDATGGDVTAAAVLAYRDVANAWATYLKHHNKGRPFVLVGHSQGSLMLQQLLAHAIEGRPEAGRMKLAILPGYNLLVPTGKTVGGTLKKTPVCTRDDETGCVLSWVSFREKNAPPAGAKFGHTSEAGMSVACTNPARPGAPGWVALDSQWNARSTVPVPGGPIRWSSEGPPPSPFLTTRGLVSARCIQDGPRGYLSIRTHGQPGAKRTDRIGGEVGAMGFFVPGWGMHLIDLQAPLGNLVARVAALAARVRPTAGAR